MAARDDRRQGGRGRGARAGAARGRRVRGGGRAHARRWRRCSSATTPPRRSTSRNKHRACEEAGMRSRPSRPAGRDRARPSCSSWSRELGAARRGRRHPRPAAAPRADRPRRAWSPRSTPARTSTASPRSTPGCSRHGTPGLVPCTPAGVMELLRHEGVELEGAEAVVVGRSKLVGVPVARLLLAANATVTVCHSRTRDLAGDLPPRRRPRRRGRRAAPARRRRGQARRRR